METNKEYIIGLDIGTTSMKASIFTSKGRFVSSESIEYPIIHPRPDWAEQDPEIIYQAALDSIRLSIIKAGIDSRNLIGIGISSAMHSLIAVDENGALLTNSIIWADNRSVDYVNELKKGKGHEIYLRTGTPIHPMSPLSKILWFKGERPDLFAQARRWISIKEYVTWKWFNQYFVDYSIASTTGLFNLNDLDWDKGALQLAGIDRKQLSEPVATTAVFRGIAPAAATYMGIPADLPVVAGASDGVLANLGVGAIDEGEVAVTIGTSGAIRTVVKEPLTDIKGRTFCYALTEDKWVIGGPVNNGGVALRWFRDQFGSEETEEAKLTGNDVYEVMVKAAERTPAGAAGLLFLPYLTGERAPHWDANTRGSFFGMTLTHTRAHFIRAVLEGVVFAVHSVGEVLEELAGESKEIRVSGGFARSNVWRQITADIFDQTVIVAESHESSGLGAAVLVLYALGHIDSLSKVKEMVHISEEQHSIPENTAVYGELFPIYKNL
ncbi:MAG TPA: gluconate kinase, partial [Bacillus bacterium]|nr:gluconate kinase [Bacillus sp. (in: firmicutes)]